MDDDKLYIPYGLSIDQEYFPGFGGRELRQFFVGILGSGIIGALLLIFTGQLLAMIVALMIGAAGVGKTAFWLYPCIEYACASGMSFLSTDTKGDVMRNYGNIARAYPHNCRFLVFDMDQRGVMKQQSDLFKLWIGILLISKNDIDPNVLQAHRLYSLNVLLNETALAESFQQTINKLNMAKYQLEKGIAKACR